MPKEAPFMSVDPKVIEKQMADKKILEIALNNSHARIQDNLYKLGVLESKKDNQVPRLNGIPMIFLVEDGKVFTLEEKNIAIDSADLTKRALLGQLFCFVPGQKYPVQVQAKNESGGAILDITISDPFGSPDSSKYDSIKYPPQPDEKPKPEWYHRMFMSWGNNRSAVILKRLWLRRVWIIRCSSMVKDKRLLMPVMFHAKTAIHSSSAIVNHNIFNCLRQNIAEDGTVQLRLKER